jgi:hypothetical protein
MEVGNSDLDRAEPANYVAVQFNNGRLSSSAHGTGFAKSVNGTLPIVLQFQ